MLQVNEEIIPLRKRQAESAKFFCMETQFGTIAVAKTGKGICALIFCKTEQDGLNELKKTAPNTTFKKEEPTTQEVETLNSIISGKAKPKKLTLHMVGTKFQLTVWNALLSIPWGRTCSYQDIANTIGHTKSPRAVGTAIGKNPISLLVPCHRVIKSSGQVGNYRWGRGLKTNILAEELATNK